MHDMILCSIFFVLYTLFIYVLGTAAVSNSKCFAYRIIIGYIIYECAIAVVGIPYQFLGLPWLYFSYYMMLIIVILFIFSIKRITKYKIKLFEEGFILFWKNHWIIFFVVFILVLLSLSNVRWLWTTNCLDDGFYVNKIATLPYLNNPNHTNMATGLYENLAFNNYLLNTGELEQSVYVYYLHVSPMIYLKYFLSAFQYFLLCCSIYAMANKIFEMCKFTIEKKYLQYVSIITILFAFNTQFFEATKLLTVQDSWQFNTAMFYGSSIVRTMGILLILLPFVNSAKIYKPDVFSAICISIMLVSKSTIAIPIIFVTCLSYLLVTLFYQKKLKSAFFAVCIIMVVAVVAYFLPGENQFSESMMNLVMQNLASPIIVASIIIMLISFTLKNKIINKLNFMMIMIYIFIIVSPFHKIFEVLSVFEFVAKRALTTYTYTFIILNFIYLIILIGKLSKGGLRIKWLSYSLLAVLTFFGFISANYDGEDSLIEKYQIILENPQLVPQSTINLAEKLENYCQENGTTLNLVMLERVYPNGYQHPAQIVLRTYALDVYPITSIIRYGVTEGNEFSEFDKDDQTIINNFISNTSNTTYEPLKAVLNQFPINCIITHNETRYLAYSGFTLYDTVIDNNASMQYYIYIK